MECAAMGKFFFPVFSSSWSVVVERRKLPSTHKKIKLCSSKFKIQATQAETHLSPEVEVLVILGYFTLRE